MIKRAFQDITNSKIKNIKLVIHKSSHRKKLLRWIFEVCNDFEYSNVTYVTAVLIIDSFTEKCGFEVEEYQMIGITCLFIAAKIEESVTKKVSDYSMVTDNTFTPEQIMQKEREIVSALDYNLLFTLPHKYFNIEYFNCHFTNLSFEEKQEILFCTIAALMERSSYTKNMFLLYLEAVKEMEDFIEKSDIDRNIKFYIQRKQMAHQALNK